jgi:hypothetical protein
MDTISQPENMGNTHQMTHLVHDNAGTSIEAATTSNSVEQKVADKMLRGVMISHIPEPIVQFGGEVAGNPKSWNLKKKCAVAFFALFSTFVA